ncbi:nicotinamide N-methyltransferase-like [Ixodes scapularis]|uniref:nicotinamide N-methyltransferase-like n=1 Tax=Ixodes scapularis TaxID=6945 RepID=UPI001A9CDC0D|nr:nicotinamide N-methyltransferase-like [Ixodes scapularis]
MHNKRGRILNRTFSRVELRNVNIMNRQEEVMESYRRDFDSKAYKEVLETIKPVYIFEQKHLHDIFDVLSVSGCKLLDVGCGPTVHNVFSAARRMNDIVLSDFLPANRLEVEKWIQKAPDAIDWSHISESLACLEGHTDIKSGAKDIEERTRRAIKKVIPCNVLDPRVLPEEHREMFDVVLCSHCLEAACADESSFQKAMQNIGNLVVRGGHLILGIIAGSHEYEVGGITLPSLALSDTMVKDALAKAGFEIKRWNTLGKNDTPEAAKIWQCWESSFVILTRNL